MFVVLLKYTEAMEAVDRLLPAHREYLDRYYASGHFLASGPCQPRTGGVILASASDRSEIERIIEQDPFKIGQVADYEIIEFAAIKACDQLAWLKAEVGI